jgi:hypothetical protein
MNKVSANIRARCKTNVRTTGCSCEADAAAIERLVQAAEAIHDHNGECPCAYADEKWNDLNAALAAFRETSDEQS